MELIRLNRSTFKSCESTTAKKILINICDYLVYGLTDTNQFYRNWYLDPRSDYAISNHDLGTVFYSTILSYHIVANLVCVQFPKTPYNLNPFKMNYFKKCCDKLLEYINENEIKEIHTPIFGTKILEGDWQSIKKTMIDIFSTSPVLEKIFIYE